jgi:hypothetical protein
MATKWYLWSIVLVFALAPAFPDTGHPKQDSSVPVAEANEWVETHGLDIHVFRGKKPVRLERCRSLLVVSPLGEARGTFEALTKTFVTVVRSERKPDRWEVYSGAAGGAGAGMFLSFTLPDNVFKVRQVIVSSSEYLVELRADGRVIQVKPGDALLIL